MNVVNTSIAGLLVLEPRVFGDARGYFMETFQQDTFNTLVAKTEFIQDNESKSSKGVLRGLHFQKPPFDQAKLVRVIEGAVLDVAVDLRTDSKTYGKHFTIELTGENKKQLFIPRGFAHGFVVLSENAIFSYKVDNTYSPANEAGLMWNDPVLNIDWEIEHDLVKLSDKDKILADFETFSSPF